MCEQCKDTGWYGDNGPGIKGNREYIPCECRSKPAKRPANPLCTSQAEGRGFSTDLTRPRYRDVLLS